MFVSKEELFGNIKTKILLVILHTLTCFRILLEFLPYVENVMFLIIPIAIIPTLLSTREQYLNNSSFIILFSIVNFCCSIKLRVSLDIKLSICLLCYAIVFYVYSGICIYISYKKFSKREATKFIVTNGYLLTPFTNFVIFVTLYSCIIYIYSTNVAVIQYDFLKLSRLIFTIVVIIIYIVATVTSVVLINFMKSENN